MEKVKRNSIWLALVLSFVVCLVGAVISGLIYYANFISAWISIAIAGLSFYIYQKFYKVNWLSFVWVLFWTIALSEVAFLISAGFIVGNYYGYSFNEAFDIFIDMLSNDNEMQNAFLRDSLLNVVFAIIGVVIYFVSFKLNVKKMAKMQAQNNANGTTINSDALQNAQNNLNIENSNLNSAPQLNNANEQTSKSNFKSEGANSAQNVLNGNNDEYKNHFMTAVKDIRSALKIGDKTERMAKLKVVYDTIIKPAVKAELEYFSKKLESMGNSYSLTDEQNAVIKTFKKFL